MSGTLSIGDKTVLSHDTNTDVVTLGNASVNETFSGIMEVDQWYLSQDYLGGQATNDPDITKKDSDSTQYWSRNNFTGFSKIGTGLTNTDGIFSFPRTGVYEIFGSFVFYEVSGGTDANAAVSLQVTIDNSTYSTTLFIRSPHIDPSYFITSSGSYILNVTDTSNVKFKWRAESFSGNNGLDGGVPFLSSGFTIKRLGPAQ